ncbi:MAG TPA: Holliday junction resolvase RecU [Candidatus Scybalousia intestinigallinarum]|nr:Holliday junction resolvase RecU [Candidatus Scybalousia intestinigallinarum]
MKVQNELQLLLNQKNIQYGNRGTNLENDINLSNKYYIDQKQAYIYKKPTPIKISKVDYPSKHNKVSKVVIREAYFEAPSTTDYNGIYKGKYIDFEAKETQNKTVFPLENIHKHQIEHLRNITSCGGIGFLIVRFTAHQKNFLLLAEDLFSYLETSSQKSIPLNYFEEKGYLIEESYLPRLPYLKIIDKIMEVS